MAPINREHLTPKITPSTNKVSLVKLKTKVAKKEKRSFTFRMTFSAFGNHIVFATIFMRNAHIQVRLIASAAFYFVLFCVHLILLVKVNRKKPDQKPDKLLTHSQFELVSKLEIRTLRKLALAKLEKRSIPLPPECSIAVFHPQANDRVKD